MLLIIIICLQGESLCGITLGCFIYNRSHYDDVSTLNNTSYIIRPYRVVNNAVILHSLLFLTRSYLLRTLITTPVYLSLSKSDYIAEIICFDIITLCSQSVSSY